MSRKRLQVENMNLLQVLNWSVALKELYTGFHIATITYTRRPFVYFVLTTDDTPNTVWRGDFKTAWVNCQKLEVKKKLVDAILPLVMKKCLSSSQETGLAIRVHCTNVSEWEEPSFCSCQRAHWRAYHLVPVDSLVARIWWDSSEDNWGGLGH